MSGSLIVVGAPDHKVGSSADHGSAYVFTLSGSTWTQTTELAVSDGETGGYFGTSVGVSGSTVVAGALGRTGSVDGAAYVFGLSGSSWSEAAELTSPDGAGGDYFGGSLAISGSTVVVGADNFTVGSHTGEGAAYVFADEGGYWSQTGEMWPSDGAAGDKFGFAVAVSGSTVVASSPLHAVGANSYEGAAYFYGFSGGAWISTAEVSASDGEASDHFGTGLAVWGQTALIGANWHAVNGLAYAGAAYFYDSEMVQPQGSGYSTDSYGGGSPSEGCIQCTSGTGGSGKAGEVVDPATQDVYTAATDLTLPGAGIPLVFSRTYDAKEAQAQSSTGLMAPPLGYGWSYNLGIRLNTATDTVTEENGAQISFAYNPSGSPPYSWCPSSSVANFCATAPRIAATLNYNSGSTPTWTLIRTAANQGLFSQDTFTFNSSGALTKITDPAGDTLSAGAYTAGSGQTACPSGDSCTAWTSSASGRVMVLAFNAASELVEVFDANSTLASNFSFSSTGCTWSGSETADLCAVTDSGSLNYIYTYDSGNATAVFDYDMLSLDRPGLSAPTTNVYTPSGYLSQQTDPTGVLYCFSGAGTNSSYLGGETQIVRYPAGTTSCTGTPPSVTIDVFSSNALIWQISGADTSAATSSSFGLNPASLQAMWTEDGDGHVSYAQYETATQQTPTAADDIIETADGAGNVSQAAYSSHNQVWCRVGAAEYVAGVRCPASPPLAPPAPGGVDPEAGMTISFYNSSDQLTATTDPLGDTTIYAYTSDISNVPSGLQYCTVDPVDYQKSVICPSYGAAHVTGTATETFDPAGEKLTSTDADGDTTNYTYNTPSLPDVVSSETDPDGTTTTYSYGGSPSLPTSETVSFGSYGATTQYAYDNAGRRFCEVDPYEYSKAIRCPASLPSAPPTPASDPYLGATITTYDADGHILQITNPLGGVSYYAYGANGKPYCSVSPAEAALGKVCPTAPPTTPATPGSDPYLGVTITTYNSSDEAVQVTNPLGGIKLTSYDPAGNAIQTTAESTTATSAADPNVVTDTTYDADNRAISTIIDPGTGQAETALDSYDPDGNVFCKVSANAYTSGLYHCPVWQPGWITSPPNPTSLYSSQAAQVTTSFYNPAGQETQTTNPDGDTSITAFDGDGRTYCISDAANVATWLTAHPTGTYPYLCPPSPPTTAPTGTITDYTTTIFDPAGRKSSSTDQVGDTTSYTYTPGGQTLTTTDPRPEVTTNCYYYQNGSSQCAQGAPAGGGSGDDLYSTATPEPGGKVTSYTYYPGGASDTINTPAGTTTDAYDAESDLTSVTYTNTKASYLAPTNLSYTYYVDGSKRTMDDATGITTYTYDADGNVASQALVATSGLSNTATAYSYYPTGVVATVSYPPYGGYTNPSVTYAYDGSGALLSETDWLGGKESFSHDSDGNNTGQDNNVSTSAPNGTSSTTFAYDNADRDTQAASTLAQTCGGSETLYQAFVGTAGTSTGSTNPDGQVTQDEESFSGSCSGEMSYERNYTYDPAGRLVYQGSIPESGTPGPTNPNNNFGYDPSGNPTTISNHDGAGNFDTYNQTFNAVRKSVWSTSWTVQPYPL